MACLHEYTVTLGPGRVGDPTVGLPVGPFEIEQYQKVANGTYGEGMFYLCDYAGDLKPLLDQHLEVRDSNGNLCYCGYVEEVYRCCGEYVAWGWSNATLFNRIAVTSSENGTQGVPAHLSAYQEDSASQSAHGVRELVVPLPSGALYTPAEYARRLLKELSQPRPVLHNTYKCLCNVTYLRTQGYYNTLAWQTHSNACGLADTGATFAHAQALGVGCRSTHFAANGSSSGTSQIGVMGDCLNAFAVGDLLVMSGWNNPQNNIITTVGSFIKDDFEFVVSDGITTSPPNFINDANNSLVEFHPGELIQIAGTGASGLGGPDIDGYYWVRAEYDGPALETQHVGFGHANYTDVYVEITHGVTINVPSNLGQEEPGSEVTIQAWHQYLCQRVCNECGTTWTATHVAIAVRAVGAPSASIALMVGLDCTAGTVQATATISAAAVGVSMAYVQAELDTPLALSPGQCLYVQAHSLAPLSTTDYYEFGGSLAQENEAKTLTSVDGVSWLETEYTTAVRLLEYRSITEQLFDLVGQGNFVTSVAVLDELTFAAPTYRSGYTSLLYAIEQLLIMGDPEGNRLQLLLDCDGNAVIRMEPTIDSEPCVTLDCYGRVADPLCTFTAGRWLCPSSPDLVDVPGVFLDSFYVSYKICRVRWIDRDFSRALFNQSLRFPGVI